MLPKSTPLTAPAQEDDMPDVTGEDRKAQQLVSPMSKQGKWRTVSVPGFGELPLPPLALYCLAVLAVVAGGIKVYSMWGQVYKALGGNVEIVLAQKHYNDKNKTEATVWEDTTGSLVVDYYKIDGAISVTRYSADTRLPPITHWIADLATIPLQPSPGNIDGGRLSDDVPSVPSSEQVSQRTNTYAQPLAAIDPRKYAAVSMAGLGVISNSLTGFAVPGQPVQGCSGRCINPHLGQFQTWNGQVNGFFVQVWRRWPDGCTHYQWWNTQYNYWDPQIWWTCCVH
jgi:hypothetical protein